MNWEVLSSLSHSVEKLRICPVTLILILRDRSTHENQCTLLTGPAKNHYSKTYGRSALLDVTHFPFFTGGLPHDWMHDRVLHHWTLLKHAISEKLFTLTPSTSDRSVLHAHFLADGRRYLTLKHTFMTMFCSLHM